MSQVIQISKSHFDELVARISRLEKMVSKLLEKEPKEGTDEWWEWSDKKALEEYRKGEYYELKDKKALNEFFDNIENGKSNRKFYNKVRQKSGKAIKKTASYHNKKTAQTAFSAV